MWLGVTKVRKSARECLGEMSDTHEEQAVVEQVTRDCAWCGNPAASKCSRPDLGPNPGLGRGLGLEEENF